MRRVAAAALVFSIAGAAPAAEIPAPTLAFSAAEGVAVVRGGKVRLLRSDAAEPAWSPDGRRIAYVSAGVAGANDVYVVDADGRNPGRITWTPADETSPSWAPDGKRLVVERHGRSVVIRAAGLGERILGEGWEPAWSPRGDRIAFTDGDNLRVMPARGGRPQTVATTPAPDSSPAWSPDGRRLVSVSEEATGADIHVLDLRSRRVTRVTADPALDGTPSFATNGTTILFASNRNGLETLWRAPASGGAAVPVVGMPSVDPAPRPAVDVAELLPDLEQRPPADLSIKIEERGGRRHFLLGFDSATDNVGIGPVVITARRPDRRVTSMQAAQVVRLAAGGRQTYPGVGVLRYVYAPSHSHWHVMGFQRYELRTADGRVVRRDRKSGFCLADHWAHAPGFFEHEPRGPVFKGYCEQGRPDALAVYQGTSVGYTDKYPSHFHGQSLDLTGVAAGDYVLVHRANRDLRLYELRYENNAAALRIRIGWPRGPKGKPSVRILRTCPSSDRC